MVILIISPTFPNCVLPSGASRKKRITHKYHKMLCLRVLIPIKIRKSLWTWPISIRCVPCTAAAQPHRWGWQLRSLGSCSQRPLGNAMNGFLNGSSEKSIIPKLGKTGQIVWCTLFWCSPSFTQTQFFFLQRNFCGTWMNLGNGLLGHFANKAMLCPNPKEHHKGLQPQDLFNSLNHLFHYIG